MQLRVQDPFGLGSCLGLLALAMHCMLPHVLCELFDHDAMTKMVYLVHEKGN